MNLTIKAEDSLRHLKEKIKGLNLSSGELHAHGLGPLFDASEEKKLALLILFYKELWLEIKSHFSPDSISILKGISLIETYYEGRALRPFTDLDLYLPDSKVHEKLCLFLMEKGYLQKEKDLLSPHKIVFGKIQQGQELVIELHSRLYIHQQHQAKIQGYKIDGEEEALFLIYHLSYQHSFLRLVWLNDLYLLFSITRLDLEKLKLKARSLGLESSLLLVYRALHILYDFKLETREALFTKIINKNFLKNPKGKLLRYHLVKIFSKENLLVGLFYYFSWMKVFLRKQFK